MADEIKCPHNCGTVLTGTPDTALACPKCNKTFVSLNTIDKYSFDESIDWTKYPSVTVGGRKYKEC